MKKKGYVNPILVLAVGAVCCLLFLFDSVCDQTLSFEKSLLERINEYQTGYIEAQTESNLKLSDTYYICSLNDTTKMEGLGVSKAFVGGFLYIAENNIYKDLPII